MNILIDENRNLYLVRLLGGLIGLSLCLNFVPLLGQGLMTLFGILAGLVFWGIGINIFAYLLSDSLKKMFNDTPKEMLYRALIIGHLPMILSILSADGIEFIASRRTYLITLEVISAILSTIFIVRVVISN